MNNRSQSSSQQETSSQYNYSKNFERAVVQTSAVTVLLGSAAYPLEFLANRKSMGMPITFASFFSAAFLRANYTTILPGLRKSYELCFMKNVAVSNHGRVSEFIGEPESYRPGYYNIMAPSFGLALVDTTATQPFINTRVMLDAGKKIPTMNWVDFYKFAKLGSPTRFSGNFLNIVGCMGATSVLRTPITKVFPEDKYGGIVPTVVTTLLSGTVVGFSNHGLKVINNRRVAAYDFDKKISPSFLSTAFKVMKNEGFRGFTKGSLISASVTVMAYSIINSVDAIANYYYGEPGFSLFDSNKKKSDPFQPPQITEQPPQITQSETVPNHNQTVVVKKIEELPPVVANQPETPANQDKAHNAIESQPMVGHSGSSPRFFASGKQNGETKVPVVEEVKSIQNKK